MIIQKTILVNKTNRNKKIYELKGYKTNDENKYLISVDDLTPSSHYHIDVKCDECGNEKDVVYKNYYKITNGLKDKYYCDECKHIKTKITNNMNYGVSTSFLREDIKLKIRKTLNDRYGVSHALQSKDIKDKMKTKLVDKYNTDNVSKIQNVKDKKVKTLKTTWIKRISKNYSFLNIIDGDYDKKILNIKCDLNKDHNFSIDLNLLHNRLEFKNVICTVCNSLHSNKSSYETQIYDFIKIYYKGDIILNSRKIISPYELDIYLPEFKIGIDFNGLHWHNELKKDKNYHKLKTDLCNEIGIQMIHIYEDDWLYKQNIIKSMILNKLKINNEINIKETELKEIIDKELVKEFLNKNHLKGYIGSKINIGLFHNGELISLMVFKHFKNRYEILRFCNKLNTNIIGGISKIFNFFIRKYSPNEVITYIDRSYSKGKSYEDLGFKIDSLIEPDYYYILNHKRKNNINFIKNNFDNKPNEQLLLDRKIYKIYDSGKLKMKYN